MTDNTAGWILMLVAWLCASVAGPAMSSSNWIVVVLMILAIIGCLVVIYHLENQAKQ